MEEAEHYTSATKQVHTCNIPDIQKDVEFVVEHLNDPNFDLSQVPSSAIEEESTKRYGNEDEVDAVAFDESVLFHPRPPFHNSNIL